MTLFESLPPYDSQAEESVVASILVDETLMNRLAPVLDAKDITPDFSLNYGLISGKIQREIKVPERCANSLGRDTSDSRSPVQAKPTRLPARDSSFDYGDYLASRDWALLKRAVKERSQGYCENCHKRPSTEVHHKTYKRLGREELPDLLNVCRSCHLFFSGYAHINPADVCCTPEEAREWADLVRDDPELWAKALQHEREVLDAYE